MHEKSALQYERSRKAKLTFLRNILSLNFAAKQIKRSLYKERSFQRLTIDDFGEEQRYIKSRLTLANVIVQIQFCNLKATIIRSRRHLRLLVRQRNDAAVNKGSSSRRLKKFYAKIRSQEEKTVTEKGNGRHSSGHLSVVRSSSLTLQMSGLISRSIVIQIRYSCDVM